jgi:hypothetical protein
MNAARINLITVPSKFSLDPKKSFGTRNVILLVSVDPPKLTSTFGDWDEGPCSADVLPGVSVCAEVH